ncbi:hypothetical protein B0H14DRAFT_3619761, partial [Mycena olivaceomarginata]
MKGSMSPPERVIVIWSGQRTWHPPRPFIRHPMKKCLTRTRTSPPSSPSSPSPSTDPNYGPQHYYPRTTPHQPALRIHIHRNSWSRWGENDPAIALDPRWGRIRLGGGHARGGRRAARSYRARPPARAVPGVVLGPAHRHAVPGSDALDAAAQDVWGGASRSWNRIVECAKTWAFPIECAKAWDLSYRWGWMEMEKGLRSGGCWAWDGVVEAVFVGGGTCAQRWLDVSLGDQPRGSRGVPVPENIQQAIRVPEKLLQGSNVVVDNAVWEAKGEPVGGGDIDLPKGPFMEDDVTSGIYPYNAYKHPFIHLKQPAEVDPKRFATQRDRFIDARMQQRIRELEALDLINSTSHGKIRALIELKSLHLLDKQRLLRAQVAETLTHGSLLPSNRPDFRRFRKPTLRDARVTEQLERKQRLDRERRARSKHVEQLAVIRDHARQVVSVNRAARDRVARLGRLVLDFHQVAEKEEQKRVERIAKERIQALKADDEEAYRVLVDNVKDTRITHLLRQTDAYLDSLAQAVAAQQNEGGRIDMRFEMEQGAATGD